MKKESPLDHHVRKKEAIPGTYRSVSHNQLILKTRASLADKGKKNYDTHKLMKQNDNLVQQQRMTPPNIIRQKTPIDHHDKGEKKKAIAGTSGSGSHLQPMLKARVSLAADKEKKNYDTHKQEGKNIKMVGQSSNRFCGICFDCKPASDMLRGSNNCNHPFCNDCISKYVAAQIQQNILKVKCPNPKCYMELESKCLQNILPKEVIDRWESAQYESSIALSQKFYCPYKDCSVLLVNDGNEGEVVTSSECPSCHRLFCAQCKVPWHANMSCKEFQKLKRSEGEKDLDKKFLELAKSKMWQRCPKCSFVIQSCGGCEHIKCRCGCNFCYKCGKIWMFGHLCNRNRST